MTEADAQAILDKLAVFHWEPIGMITPFGTIAGFIDADYVLKSDVAAALRPLYQLLEIRLTSIETLQREVAALRAHSQPSTLTELIEKWRQHEPLCVGDVWLAEATLKYCADQVEAALRAWRPPRPIKEKEDAARVGPSVPCVAPTGSTAEQLPGDVTATERTEPIDIETMRANLHDTFSGGWHHSKDGLEAFHHGMDTVCNVLASHQKGEGSNGILPTPAGRGAPPPLYQPHEFIPRAYDVDPNIRCHLCGEASEHQTHQQAKVGAPPPDPHGQK